MRSLTRVIATLLLAATAACVGADPTVQASLPPEASSPQAGPPPPVVASPQADPTPQTSPTPQTTPSSPAPATIAPSEGFATTRLVLRRGDDRVELTAWVADTRSLRRRGLMERASLPDDAGMLFVFDALTRSGFWMKNTSIPLSIAFFDDDGRLLETLDMAPCDADPCPLYSPGVTYRYALEVNQGFYTERGITADWRLDIDRALGTS